MKREHTWILVAILVSGGLRGSQFFADAHAQAAEMAQQRSNLPSFKLPARWSVRINSATGEPLALKVAIGFDESLELFHTSTPFQFDFTAHRYTALISSETPGAVLVVEEWTDLYGVFQKGGGFSGGAHGKLLFNPAGPTFSSAGSGF
jgi:hypothetical protein